MRASIINRISTLERAVPPLGMNLKQSLRLVKKVLADHAEKENPVGVVVVHLKPDGTMSKNDKDRLKSNAGGLNIIGGVYTDGMRLKTDIGSDADSD